MHSAEQNYTYIVPHKEFAIMNWLIMNETFNQFINFGIYKYVNSQHFFYLTDIFGITSHNNKNINSDM